MPEFDPKTAIAHLDAFKESLENDPEEAVRLYDTVFAAIQVVASDPLDFAVLAIGNPEVIKTLGTLAILGISSVIPRNRLVEIMDLDAVSARIKKNINTQTEAEGNRS